ncbi:MAG: N-6 DNA methylase [Acidimicrobiales bacterium]|nr:N-6 DNA methylase [Acidimicrobiales bacterium]
MADGTAPHPLRVPEPAARRRLGAFDTPADVAERLAGLALRPLLDGGVDPRDLRVCDPAVGGGAFLLAAADLLAGAGVAPAHVVRHCLWGADLDAEAVELCRANLRDWARARGVSDPPDPGHLEVGDGLGRRPDVWPDPPAEGFDAVIGNPPFLGQLQEMTARSPAQASRVRSEFGEAAFRYADTAGLFLLGACHLSRPGGRVALILPQSFLASTDLDAVRREVLGRASLEQLWLAGEAVFPDAAVHVCAPVLVVGGSPRRYVVRTTGRSFAPAPAAPAELLAGSGSWAPLLADLLGAPVVDLRGAGVVGDLASATAGFRDQYYGLAPYVREAAEVGDTHARLVTSGLIDPARCHWGQRATRFGGRRWDAPVVDLPRLQQAPQRPEDGVLARWTEARLQPKVVVATQTRVVEAAVDREGNWYPSVPTIAVTPHTEAGDLWRTAAVLLAPPISAWALGRAAGTALSADGFRLSARQVLHIPLPVHEQSWERGAELAHEASSASGMHAWREALVHLGSVMCRAYGVGQDVLEWWVGRLPRAR